MLESTPALSALAAASAPAAPKSQAGTAPHAFARELELARPKGDAPQAGAGAQAGRGSARPADGREHDQATGAAARGRADAVGKPSPSNKRPADTDEPAAGVDDRQAGIAPGVDDPVAADAGALLASLLGPAMALAVQLPRAAGPVAAAEGRAAGARPRASALEGTEARLAAPAGSAAAVSPANGVAAVAEAAEAASTARRDVSDDVAAGTAGAAARVNDGPGLALPQAPAPAQFVPGTAGAAAPAPYAAQIAAPVGSPDFAPGLSAQLSVMVRDGLQEARLQLNPAEMGPITVQIQLDGQQAQVTMIAEQAPTRQALEQAMPMLASALREDGLTLTGGGVFEQPPPGAQQDAQREQAQRDAAASRRATAQTGSDAELRAAAPVHAGRAGSPRGVLDLYA